jgi:hypothetical protein
VKLPGSGGCTLTPTLSPSEGERGQESARESCHVP